MPTQPSVRPLHMHNFSCVLVIGTTADYIEWIRTVCPGPDRVVFVTSPEIRQNAVEPAPTEMEEILCNLTDEAVVFQCLKAHLEAFALKPMGISCFDCESLMLAGAIAEHLGLSYPSRAAIGNCRDKYLSKVLWRNNRVNCADFCGIRSLEELKSFYNKRQGPCVLKPLTGSGSELVFVCDSLQSCEENYRIIREELGRRENNRLYSTAEGKFLKIIVEELVEGDEYSCDFMVTCGRVEIVRIARKLKASGKPFGTIGGYVLPAMLPKFFSEELLPEALSSAAGALGLTACVCMADFIVRDGEIVFLEMTPRPGGDCLPSLLRCACGLDILKLAIDFAAKRKVIHPDAAAMVTHVGVRIHAGTAGILKRIDADCLMHDPRVLEVCFSRKPGHRIVLPPADYDAWMLGHVIISVADGVDPEQEFNRIHEHIIIEIETDEAT